MTNPLISVVIPSFNHDRFIKKAIDSVINQTYKNWEIIIVDNNSTDNTDSTLNNYSLKNLKIFKINNDGIIALSRNKGIKHSNGEWIAFLDSDDEWHPSKLQICVNEISPNIDFIYHDLIINYKTNKLFKKKILKGYKYEHPITKSLLIKGNRINNSSVLVKKNLLKKIGYISIDKDMVASEDYNTWLKISNFTNGFKYIPQPLGFYTFHISGVSRRNMTLSMKKATTEFLYLLNEHELNLYKANIDYIFLRFNFSNKIQTKSNKYFISCLKYGNIEIKLKALYLYFMQNIII